MSSLEERRRARAEEKERVKNRLAAMEPLLAHTYVRQEESPQQAALRRHAAEVSYQPPHPGQSVQRPVV